jgi:membrane fusion protein (multidrug efflux system)
MNRAAAARSPWLILRGTFLGALLTVVVGLLILWLAGAFHPKIPSRSGPPPVSTGRPIGSAELHEARLVRIPAIESAVGTVRAVHEAAIGSKLLAKVREINVVAGQSVRRGDVLARLEDEDLRARVQQAAAAAESARAARDQARIELERVQKLFEQSSAAPIELERARTAFDTALAEVERSEQARREAETLLSYATIVSPIDAVVIDKRVETGDTVTPGQTLLTLFDPTRMQLIASVRESLAGRLEVGQNIDVRLEALERTCVGQISEIVPAADPASRSFTVKVTGPCPPGVRSGMFGRILIPLDPQEVLLIPRAAVRRVGQLDLVEVAHEGGLRRRTVQLGRDFEDQVEVLAGLRAGERVAVENTE